MGLILNLPPLGLASAGGFLPSGSSLYNSRFMALGFEFGPSIDVVL
jgi:hypothetical protein